MQLTPHQIRYLLRLMNRGEGSNIRPDPSFTGQDALALAERLKERLSEAEK